jgi:hypothetical protein
MAASNEAAFFLLGASLIWLEVESQLRSERVGGYFDASRTEMLPRRE